MNPITELQITYAEIDHEQMIDENRSWKPIFAEGGTDDSSVFVGFYAGDSPSVGEELEYTSGYIEEAFWVYKTDYTISDLKEGLISPNDLIFELKEEQPNIEIAGICKYVRNLSTE